MRNYVRIDLRRIDSNAGQELVRINREAKLRVRWAVDGKLGRKKYRQDGTWSFGGSEAGGGDNTKGVFCGGRVDRNPRLMDSKGSPCQAQAEVVAKLLLVKYLNASTSMGAEEFEICTDNVSSVVDLMDRSEGGRKHKFSDGFGDVLLMLATELVKLLEPRNASMRIKHKNHPDAYQRGAKPRDWDPDRVAALGLTGCDMRPHDWEVGIDECAVRRLKFTEQRFEAGNPSLLLSVKIEVEVVEARDVWIKTHWKGRWLWRHVKSNEKFWEDNGMAVACDDGNATDSVGIRWKTYCDVEGRRVWVDQAGRWFYACTGTRNPSEPY